VKLKAENGGEATKLEGWLDAVLDELATPQKRPFEGMDAPPPEPAQDPTPAPAEEPKVKPVAEEAAAEPEPPAPVEEPVAPPKDPEQERPGKLRRLLGL
jgi:hypothetical protein